MPLLDSIGNNIANNYPAEDLLRFEKAIQTAETLKSKLRKSGDTYYDHNLRVAGILAQNKAVPEAIITAIIQGCNLPDSAITELFRQETTALMRQVEELRALTFKNKQLQAEAFRKMILTTLTDVRAVLVKLATKLDNLHSITAFPLEEQQRIAREVLDIYAPLAYRLGIDKIKSQLEDLAFRILNPHKYREIYHFLEQSSEQRELEIKTAINFITAFSSGKVKIISIKGRFKSIYSIYKKIVDRNYKLQEMFDLSGIRVIMPEIKDCYLMLGLLHEHFEPMEGRLKDYIAAPKPNSYQSIHTAVKMADGKIIEIQIRTPEMDELAEEGIAAHWRYKGLKSEQAFEKRMAWLRGILELQKDNPNFLETLKVDIFGDKIYCYTPKGDIKELPKGASILDFAYLVHEQVGNKAVAARVNGVFVPLKHILCLGDIVEIVTNKGQRPRRSWIKLVKSPRAQQKIRKSLKEYDHLPAFHYRELKIINRDEQAVLIESKEYLTATCILAKCCLAVPGDEIVGLITKRRVISVHKTNCRVALKEQERWIMVNWKETYNQKIIFHVRAAERSGLLADLVHTIAAAEFEVKEAKAKLAGSSMAECSFSIIPKRLDQLKMLIAKIGKVRGIKTIYFE
ncbi:MAG TPA: HD domain-containing protein [Candidatus Nanoarchaeia archaeon]|nr:HD domain-containing protein [Candidatus Nanoarchaeia archaeon]